jgi:hypothetical protein
MQSPWASKTPGSPALEGRLWQAIISDWKSFQIVFRNFISQPISFSIGIVD